MALMGGFARIGNNEITILVNDAEKNSDIDPQEAQQTLEIAEANLRKAEGKRQTIEANLALRRARTRFPVLDRTTKNSVISTTLNDLSNWSRLSSLWPLLYGTSCCFIEFASLIGSRFDFDRYGLVPRSSPRQADLILTAGTVTMKMAPSLVRLYEQMPEPKYVIAMGACTITGGMFSTDSYSTVRGVDKLIPVDVYLPGCPPKPEAVIDAITKLRKKIAREIYKDRIRPQRGGLLASVYHLTRIEYGVNQAEEVCIKVFTHRSNPRIPSVFWVWKSTDFQERESYDMLGITYDSHPRLKRILMPESWIGWPLLNGRIVDIPSYRCKPRDIITVKDEQNSRTLVQNLLESSAPEELPNHLTLHTFQYEGLVNQIIDRKCANQQGDSELAEAWFAQAAEYWKQAITLTPGNYIEAQNWLTITRRFE
ncbi:hypothetical protein Bca4012_052303 [Brassica carinata]